MSGMNDVLDDSAARHRGRAIANLRWHWGEAYDITWDRRFRARRLDDGQLLEAGTPAELRSRIIDDYAERPVPRLP
jgi:hypothetical protein